MRLIVNILDAKLIQTLQGVYLKTVAPYKYMIVLLPETAEINQIGNELLIDVDDYFYKRKRMYRFDKNHIHAYMVTD